MAGHIPVMFGWSLTEVSVLYSNVFGLAELESCAGGLRDLGTGGLEN